MAIKVGELSAELAKILEGYSQDVREAVDRVVADTGKQAKKDIQAASPKKTGKYRKGWRVKKEGGALGQVSTAAVYNATDYRLTHLLEHGHQKAGGGRVEGISHIAPVEEEQQSSFTQAIQKAIEGVGR